MFAGVQNHEAFFFLTVTNLTARNNIQPRRWGMLVQVTEDGTPANNTAYILRRGLASTDINDNNNWQTLSAFIGGVINFAAPNYFPISNGTNLLSSKLQQLGTFEGTLFTGNNILYSDVVSNFSGTVTSGNVSTQVLIDSTIAALIANSSALCFDFTLVGVRSDGTQSFRARRRGVFRKDSGGTFVLDGQEALELIESDAGAVAGMVLVVNSSLPAATLTMGGASNQYKIKGISRLTVTI